MSTRQTPGVFEVRGTVVGSKTDTAGRVLVVEASEGYCRESAVCGEGIVGVGRRHGCSSVALVLDTVGFSELLACF